MKYVIQRYERCAYYEPAEGGYYYDGREPDDEYESFETKSEAKKALVDLIVELNEGLNKGDEGYLVLSNNGLEAYSINHRYIGDGEEFYVEPLSRRGRHASGRQVYC